MLDPLACGLCLESPAFPSRESGGTVPGTQPRRGHSPNWTSRKRQTGQAGEQGLTAAGQACMSFSREIGAKPRTEHLLAHLVTLLVDPTRLSRRLVLVLLSRCQKTARPDVYFVPSKPSCAASCCGRVGSGSPGRLADDEVRHWKSLKKTEAAAVGFRQQVCSQEPPPLGATIRMKRQGFTGTVDLLREPLWGGTSCGSAGKTRP